MNGSPAPFVTATSQFTVDNASEDAVVEMIMQRTGALSDAAPRLIVTPNMNHLAILERSAVLGEAYDRAALRLADGWPVVRLARMLGADIDDRTTGSGIVARLAAVEGAGRRVYVIGGSTADSHRRAVARFAAAGWRAAGHPASREWLSSHTSLEELVAELEQFQPDLVLIGVGAIKQEHLAVQLMDAAAVPAVYMGVGASIDFLAGQVARAPHWARALHLEFLHRILMEPKRMVKRYVGDVPGYLAVVRRSERAASRASSTVAHGGSDSEQEPPTRETPVLSR